jgi:hypothetical protein
MPRDQEFQKLWCEQAEPAPDHDPGIIGGNTARFTERGPRGSPDCPFLKRPCTGGLPQPTS